MDEVNCWIVKNELGEDIVCCFDGYEVEVKNNHFRKLSFLQSEVGKKEKICFTVVVDGKVRLKEIDFNEVGIKKLSFRYEGSRYQIYKQSHVDIGRNVKYVKLYTAHAVINDTNKDIPISLKSSTSLIPPSATLFLPFHLPQE